MDMLHACTASTARVSSQESRKMACPFSKHNASQSPALAGKLSSLHIRLHQHCMVAELVEEPKGRQLIRPLFRLGIGRFE